MNSIVINNIDQSLTWTGEGVKKSQIKFADAGRTSFVEAPACGEERDGGAHHDEDAGHVEEVCRGRAEVEGDRVVHDVHVLGESKADYSFLS